MYITYNKSFLNFINLWNTIPFSFNYDTNQQAVSLMIIIIVYRRILIN